MVGAVCLAVIFGYAGLLAWSTLATPRYMSELSAPARRAVDVLEKGGLPTQDEVAALAVESGRINDAASREQDLALVVLTLIASLCGVLGGTLLAKRLSGPLESLAAAARSVAGGDLRARARPRFSGAGETAQLIQDFNDMADALQRSDRQLKESSAAIAHELRTPLTVLRGRLQGMRDGVFEAGEREIDALIRHVDGLTRIVEDLKTVSNAEAGELSLRVSLTDLAEVADDLIRTVRPDLERGGFAVELDLRPTPIHADAERVRQVLLALLENARLHAAEGRSIRVETLGEDHGAVMRVLDRGPGVGPEDAEQAFQPFWRADSSRSRVSGGTGLGLAVVAAIMRAHGGGAQIQNRPGGGAVVTLTFPRV